MKGIAFTVIAEIVIAIAAATIFFVILQTLISETSNTSLCPVYHAIHALPLPNHLKPYNPECESIRKDTQRQILDRKITDELLLEYINDCWKKDDYGKGGVDFICYELFLPNVETKINEITITKVLKDNKGCDKLPNNFIEAGGESFDCGKENKLFWKIGDIQGKDITVIIKFDAFNHRISVI